MKKVIFNTIKFEGPKAFYKGISSPMTTIPLVNAIVFGVYSTTKMFI